MIDRLAFVYIFCGNDEDGFGVYPYINIEDITSPAPRANWTVTLKSKMKIEAIQVMMIAKEHANP